MRPIYAEEAMEFAKNHVADRIACMAAITVIASTPTAGADRPMKIYISGKITGDPDYKQKFNLMAARIRADGNIPLNPATNPEGLTAEEYMRIDFAMIDVADVVLALDDAGDSPGAQLELAYSRYIKKPVMTEEDLNE